MSTANGRRGKRVGGSTRVHPERLDADRLRSSLDALAAAEPAFAAAIELAGYPEPRVHAPGHATLLRTIIGQQVSTRSADAVWQKLAGLLGSLDDPSIILRASDKQLRAAGLSRQKMIYARDLAEAVCSGRLDLTSLPADDAAAIAALLTVKGVGRWSAEIYLLFAEGRADIWPAGDLAVRIAVGRILGHATRPSESLVRELAERWRPHRGAAATFAWHYYLNVADTRASRQRLLIAGPSPTVDRLGRARS